MRLIEEAKLVINLFFVIDGVDLLDFLSHQGKYVNESSSPRPDLILLDLNMPKMDGREALKEIKSEPALINIPVVVLSTSRAQKDIRCTYNLGVNSFISKPMGFDHLVEIFKILYQYWFQEVKLPSSVPHH